MIQFSDLEQYYKLIRHKKFFNRFIKFNKLHPDKIDNKAFWKEAEEKFGVDPVAQRANSIEHGNQRNRDLFIHFNGLSLITYLESYKRNLNCLDIGCGYGWLKQFLTERPDKFWKVTQLDILDRIKDGSVIEIDTNLHTTVEKHPDLIKEWDLVVMSNVSQHLSDKQYRGYLFFINSLAKSAHINMVTSLPTPIFHYGQTTYSKEGEYTQQALSNLRVLSYGVYQNSTGLNFIQKPTPPDPSQTKAH